MDVHAQLVNIAWLALAATLGAAVGFEREFRGYSAGLRTLALVCLGAALFTENSSLFGDAGTSRVAAQIVTGIGFLCAGVIVREGFTVKGITTAATIWTVAGIGMAAGRHLLIIALFTTVVVVVLLELDPIARRVNELGRRDSWYHHPEETRDGRD